MKSCKELQVEFYSKELCLEAQRRKVGTPNLCGCAPAACRNSVISSRHYRSGESKRNFADYYALKVFSMANAKRFDFYV